MANRNPNPETQRTEQGILNKSYDKDFDVLAVEMLGYDATHNAVTRIQADSVSGLLSVEPYNYNGSSTPTPTVSKEVATKVQTSGNITYVGKAAPGTAQSAATWQAKSIDTSSGVVVLWADGNAAFDNVATDLSSLTYS